MKVKKNVREEIRKPDIVQSSMQRAIAWVNENRAKCIGIAVIVVAVAAAGWGYGFYRNSKDEKAQYLLSEGMRSYQEYTAQPNGDALARSEGSFGQAARVGSNGVRDVARLYLARIATIKGSKEQAKLLYSEVSKSASSDVVKKLSDAALQDLDKKQ